jgi:reactive intermediate/imine deaminase
VSAAETGKVVAGFIVPGMPHPLLCPERSPAWAALRRGYDRVRQAIEALDADLLVLYSTGWPSVIGHQLQADPAPVWTHVDPEWHDLGSIPYALRMDAAFAKAYEASARARGLHARTVAYKGFPIDTGSVVALQLLNPGNRLPATIVSCNMYADRAETLVLGKAGRDAVEKGGRKAVAVAVTALSNRLFTQEIDPKEDRISSLKDDEWNRKLLELLGQGRLEDVAQLAREFSAQANGDSKGKAFWWLASILGQHNAYDGTVHEYQPVWGTGAALVGLVPSARAAADKEFDEEDVEVYRGERNVLSGASPARTDGASAAAPRPATSATAVATPPAASTAGEVVMAKGAPAPVGAYPHARRVGELLYLSGVGPRQPGTNAIPGGPVKDADGRPRDYDVAAQTRATIENVKAILEAAGSSIDKVVDVTVFLIDMDRDFAAYNAVYKEYFAGVQATRTTLAVTALPTPIAVELKVIARA